MACLTEETVLRVRPFDHIHTHRPSVTTTSIDKRVAAGLSVVWTRYALPLTIDSKPWRSTRELKEMEGGARQEGWSWLPKSGVLDPFSDGTILDDDCVS